MRQAPRPRSSLWLSSLLLGRRGYALSQNSARTSARRRRTARSVWPEKGVSPGARRGERCASASGRPITEAGEAEIGIQRRATHQAPPQVTAAPARSGPRSGRPTRHPASEASVPAAADARAAPSAPGAARSSPLASARRQRPRRGGRGQERGAVGGGKAGNRSSLGLRATRGRMGAFLRARVTRSRRPRARRRAELGRTRRRDRHLRAGALGHQGRGPRRRLRSGAVGERHCLVDEIVALAGASLGGACAVASADETISLTCADRSVGTASPAARAEPTCRPARTATATAQPFTNVLQRGPRSAWVLRFFRNRPIDRRYSSSCSCPPSPAGAKRSHPRRNEPHEQCSEQRDGTEGQQAGPLGPLTGRRGHRREPHALDRPENGRHRAPKRAGLCSVPWRLLVAGRPGGRRRKTGGLSGCGSADRPPERLFRLAYGGMGCGSAPPRRRLTAAYLCSGLRAASCLGGRCSVPQGVRSRHCCPRRLPGGLSARLIGGTSVDRINADAGDVRLRDRAVVARAVDSNGNDDIFRLGLETSPVAPASCPVAACWLPPGWAPPACDVPLPFPAPTAPVARFDWEIGPSLPGLSMRIEITRLSAPDCVTTPFAADP